MKKYLVIGIIGLIIIMIATAFAQSYFQLFTHKLIVEYNEKREKEKSKKEEKKKKKKSEKFSRIFLGNPYLEAILKQYNIIVFGALGAGKTLFANLLCKYLHKKYAREDKKNYRYNKYMNPDYLADLKKLEDNKLLRVYSNIPLEDSKTGFQNQDFWAYYIQQKRFIFRPIALCDEMGENVGKQLWFSNNKNSPEIDGAVDTSRYGRQNVELKLIATEQAHDNIFKPIRDRGFTEVHALKTYTGLSKFGKLVRNLINFLKLVLPGYITINFIKTFQKTLFLKDKILLAFSLLLPAYFSTPREYYISKSNLLTWCKKHFLRFSTLINFYGNEMLFKFKKSDIFNYNTRGHESTYLKQFDKEGNRIYA